MFCAFQDVRRANKLPFQQFSLDGIAVILVLIEVVALLDLWISHFGASTGLLRGGAVLRGHKLAM
jgi:hypothetical protein